MFGSVDESQGEKCASSVIPVVVGAQIPFLGPKDQGYGGREGLDSGASGCRTLTCLGGLRDDRLQGRQSPFSWYFHPPSTSLQGLIFNQALSHLLDIENQLSFPAKYISLYIFYRYRSPSKGTSAFCR